LWWSCVGFVGGGGAIRVSRCWIWFCDGVLGLRGKVFVLELGICEVKKRDVLFSVYFGQERATWDYMDSCAFGEEAPQESGG